MMKRCSRDDGDAQGLMRVRVREMKEGERMRRGDDPQEEEVKWCR